MAANSAQKKGSGIVPGSEEDEDIVPAELPGGPNGRGIDDDDDDDHDVRGNGARAERVISKG